jgi:hypothetical protein
VTCFTLNEDVRSRPLLHAPSPNQGRAIAIGSSCGSSLGYQLASVIAGGPAPLIATWLYGTYHSAFAIAIYIAICAVITLIATAMMSDYTGKDISGEYQSR